MGHHHHPPHATAAAAVLDIGGDVGALVLHTPSSFDGREIELQGVLSPETLVHTEIHPREHDGTTLHAGVYPALKQGRYRILLGGDADPEVEILGGQVSEYRIS